MVQATQIRSAMEEQNGRRYNMKKLIQEIKSLSWTLGGTGLVLITLSGQTRTYGILISGAALAVYLLMAVFGGDD